MYELQSGGVACEAKEEEDPSGHALPQAREVLIVLLLLLLLLSSTLTEHCSVTKVHSFTTGWMARFHNAILLQKRQRNS
jgi:hypothetical protein